MADSSQERQRKLYEAVLKRLQEEGFETPRQDGLAVSVEELARRRREATVRSEWLTSGFWTEALAQRLAEIDHATADLQAEARRDLRRFDPPRNPWQQLLGGF